MAGTTTTLTYLSQPIRRQDTRPTWLWNQPWTATEVIVKMKYLNLVSRC